MGAKLHDAALLPLLLAGRWLRGALDLGLPIVGSGKSLVLLFFLHRTRLRPIRLSRGARRG